MDYLIESLIGLIAIATGFGVMSVVSVALLGPEEPDKPKNYWSGRSMIVMGLFFVGGGLLFTMRLACPWLPWHWIRGYRAGAGPIETWQVVVPTVALYAFGARALMLGFRLRRRARSGERKDDE